MAKPLLTKAKHARVTARPGVVRGKPLNYNAAAQARYAAKLDALVAEMTAVTRHEVERLFRSDEAAKLFAQDRSVASQARILTNSLTKRFDQLFGRKAQGLAEGMVNDADKLSRSTLHASLKELSGGLSLKTSVLTGPLRESMAAMVAENVALIKSIGQQYLTDVQGAVMRSITTGNGLQDLVPALANLEGVTKRRANNIALDQTRKAYSGINAGRMQAIGIDEFEWLHSGGGQKPRPDHVAMSGNIYSFKNLPVVNARTGARGKPADEPNCRCRMIPVIKFGDDTQ